MDWICWQTDNVGAGLTNQNLPLWNVPGGPVSAPVSSMLVPRDGHVNRFQGNCQTLPAGAELVTFEWRRSGVTIGTHIVRAAGPDPPDGTQVAVAAGDVISCRVTTGATNATADINAGMEYHS